MLPHDIYPRGRSPDTVGMIPPVARPERYALGEVTVGFLEAQSNSLRRAADWQLAEGSDSLLFQARRAESHFRLAHVEITARPWDCVLIPPGGRCEIDCPRPPSAVVLGLPGQWLERWLPRLDASPYLFRAAEGWSAALCTVVGAITPVTIRGLTLPGSALADNIGALLALSAGPRHQGPPRSLFDSLRQELRASLHRPELSPAQLAARQQISVRALHYAFATGRTTFMKELIRVRLERSAELLREGQVKLTVHEVARRCGFTDTGHFTRRFRERFGQTPAKFRDRVHLARASSSHPAIPGRLARERCVHELDEGSHFG